MTSAWLTRACSVAFLATVIACGGADEGVAGAPAQSPQRADEGVFPLSEKDGDRRISGRMDALAIDADYVYVAGVGQILRLPRNGGQTEFLTNHWQGVRRSEQATRDGSFDPRHVYRASLVLDRDYIYWCETAPERFGADADKADPDHSGRIVRMMKGGGQVETVIDGLDDPSSLLIDGETMYWTNGAVDSPWSTVMRWDDFRSLTHEPAKVTTARLPHDLNVVNGEVVFAAVDASGSHGIERVSVLGGEPELLVSGRGSIASLSASNGKIAWVESPDCMNCGGAFLFSRDTRTITNVRSLLVAGAATLLGDTFLFGTTAEEPSEGAKRTTSIFSFDGTSGDRSGATPLRTVVYENIAVRPMTSLAADASRVYWLDHDLGLTFGTDTILRSAPR